MGDTPITSQLRRIPTAAGWREKLGLILGTDVQPYDADLAAIAGLTATTNNVIQSVSSAWASRTPTQLAATFPAASTTLASVVELATSAETITGTDTVRAVTPAGGAAAYQPLDADLTTIAGLTATTDNFLIAVASAWASRTPAQALTTLGIEVGTYSPTMAFQTPGTSSFSYATQQGNYIKVSNYYLVWANLTVTPTVGTGSGDIRLSTPVTVGSQNGVGFVGEINNQWTQWGLSRTAMGFRPVASAAYGVILGLAAAQTAAPFAASYLTSGSSHTINFGCVFKT